VNDGKAGRFFVLFFEEDDRGVVAVCGEFRDLPEGEFMTVAVG